MLSIFKKKQETLSLLAPVTGVTIDLEHITDPVFSSKVMGDDIAFSFDGDTVCAPCDGKITMIAETAHAFGMELDDGIEILIHIGLDTVNLNGQGFEVLAASGKKVKVGTPIIRIDRAYMASHGIDLTTPMVITEPNGHALQITAEHQSVIAAQTPVIDFIEC